LRAVLAVALFPIHSSASADETAYDAGNLDTIVITAGREEERQSVPATINAVSGEAAREDAASWIGETINKVPGVYFARLRGPVDAPSVRFPITYSNYYLYLQDNVPLQSPIAYNHAALAYSAALTSFGGIEVLKGPGSALHGSDAFAAVINVKSAEPSEKAASNGRVAAGSYGFAEARGEVSGPMGDRQSALAAASVQREDGWRDHTGWDRLQGVFRHRYKGDGDLQIDTIGIVTRFDSEMVGALTEDEFAADPRNDGLQDGVPVDDATDREDYFRLSTEIKKPLGASTRLSVTPYARRIDMQYMAVWYPDTTPVVREEQRTAGVLARLYHKFTEDSETVVGVDADSAWYNLTETQSRPDAVVFGFFDSPQGVHYDYDVDFLALSPYVQHTQRFGDWVVEPGLRFDSLRYDYANNAGAVVFGSYYRRNDRRDFFTSFNPKLGLAYLIAPDKTVYARYAHAFRIPSVYDIYSLDTSNTEFSLDPEQLDSYEVGYKGALGPRAELEADVYYSHSRDGITVGIATPAGDVKANGGENEYKGAELGLSWRPVDAWEMELSYARSAHKIIRKRADGPSPADGKAPNSAPENLGNARITWRPSFLPRFFVQPELLWIGKWWVDDLNTRRKPNDVIVNARVQCGLTERTLVHLKLLNLFDRKYPATMEDQGFGTTIRPGYPFTVAGGVEWTF
jgi:outer membrane receptor protein involved in Fe transport